MAPFRTKELHVSAQQWYPGLDHPMVCYVCPQPCEAHVHSENGPILLNERDWIVQDRHGRSWIVTAAVFELAFTPDVSPRRNPEKTSCVIS